MTGWNFRGQFSDRGVRGEKRPREDAEQNFKNIGRPPCAWDQLTGPRRSRGMLRCIGARAVQRTQLPWRAPACGDFGRKYLAERLLLAVGSARGQEKDAPLTEMTLTNTSVFSEESFRNVFRASQRGARRSTAAGKRNSGSACRIRSARASAESSRVAWKGLRRDRFYLRPTLVGMGPVILCTSSGATVEV